MPWVWPLVRSGAAVPGVVPGVVGWPGVGVIGWPGTGAGWVGWAGVVGWIGVPGVPGVPGWPGCVGTGCVGWREGLVGCGVVREGVPGVDGEGVVGRVGLVGVWPGLVGVAGFWAKLPWVSIEAAKAVDRKILSWVVVFIDRLFRKTRAVSEISLIPRISSGTTKRHRLRAAIDGGDLHPLFISVRGSFRPPR